MRHNGLSSAQILDSFNSGMLELGCHPNVPEKKIKTVEESWYENDRLKAERKTELDKAMNDPSYGFDSREK